MEDNVALYHALASGLPLCPIFIFDTDILDRLENRRDARLHFIYNRIALLNKQLQTLGSSLLVYHGRPQEVFENLIRDFNINAVYANHDYEPYGINRDKSIGRFLQQKGFPFHTYKDQVIFERDEVKKDNAQPYAVFTPYMKRWKQQISEEHIRSHDSAGLAKNFIKLKAIPMPKMAALGFMPAAHIPEVNPVINIDKIRSYDRHRDYPALDATTHLSVHLRFGTISIRKLVEIALQENETFLNELIWREFYMMILWHFPYVEKQSFKKKYDRIPWQNDENQLQAWMEGMTGYPMVDAGMRQLNSIGFMHNRLRMITASFLTKHLLIDWRIGEKYFADKLIDYELSSNNGGWQWAAGSGCDASPWFRIFNPYIQEKKFDPDGEFIKKWIPELDTDKYPAAIIDHKRARQRTLKVFKQALQNQ